MPGAEVSADIEMEDGVPRITNLRVEGFRPGTVYAKDLAKVDWVRSLDEEVLIEAATQRLKSYGPRERLEWNKVFERSTGEWTQQISQRDDEIRRTLRTARRKNGVTAERLEDVLRLYDEGGIEAVQKKAKKGQELSRSYAYQLLNRGRKEIQK